MAMRLKLATSTPNSGPFELPEPDDQPTCVADGCYWARYEGHRYVYKHSENKVQAYFSIVEGACAGVVVELLMAVRKRAGGYAVKSARSKLGRSMRGTSGVWQWPIANLASVEDLVVQTRTVCRDSEGEELHADDRYSLVNRFWSDSHRPGNAP